MTKRHFVIAALFGLLLQPTGLIAQTHRRAMILRVGGGPPGSTEFEVRLDDSPLIRVKKSAMPIIPPGKLTETNTEVPVRHPPAEPGAFECEPLEAAMRGR